MKKMICSLLSLVFLSGCIILSNYSATSYEHLTQLKAYHIKFIDDFTTEHPCPVDDLKILAIANEGDLKFREAKEYAAGMNDDSRVFSIKVLYDAFKDDIKWLRRGKTFHKKYSQQLMAVRESSYDQAIRGEMAREGATK